MGTRNTKTSCFVFCVYRYKHENPKSKHETNTKKLKNLHVLLDLLSTTPFPLAFSPLADSY